MKKILIVVDMQTDFINGSLGTDEAVQILPNVVKKIQEFDGDTIISTVDTHGDDYFYTQEGQNLPIPHCIYQTSGWEINKEVRHALINWALVHRKKIRGVKKNTFGARKLPKLLHEIIQKEECVIEFVGLCTDICVISNVLLIKAYFPEAKIIVDASCCAGTTPERHQAALETMRSCLIDVIE